MSNQLIRKCIPLINELQIKVVHTVSEEHSDYVTQQARYYLNKLKDVIYKTGGTVYET